MASSSLRSGTTVQSSSSSSGTGLKATSHIADESEAVRDLAASGLDRYQLVPPPWTKPMQAGSADTGWPGMYPPHPGAQEYAITPLIVQNGWSQQPLCPNETFSLHQMLYRNLTANEGNDFQHGAAALYDLIMARKQAKAGPASDATLKLPSRATLNEQKRENWLRDLADPAVPLARLARSVPHGFKGERMLEMLVQRQIPSDRAIWYLRAISIADVISQRKRSNANLRFTAEWTLEVCRFYSTLIRDVGLPLAQATSTAYTPSTASSPAGPGSPAARFAGMQVKTKPRQSVLSDAEGQKVWTRKFTYASVLLNHLKDERLLDLPTCLVWLVDELRRADLAQLSFVLYLVALFKHDFALWSRSSLALVEACLGQLRTIGEHPAHPCLVKVSMTLRNMVQTTFASAPESFVQPSFWMTNREHLHAVLLVDPEISSDARGRLSDLFETIDGRAYVLAGGFNSPLEDAFVQKAQLISILDDHQDPSAVHDLWTAFFIRPPFSLSTKLDVLLSWATSPSRIGNHRTLMASAFLRLVRASHTGPQDLQDAMANWLERSHGEEEKEREDALVRLVDDLARNGVFSPGAYFQRAVARGESDLLAARGNGIKALLSEYMPLASASQAMRNQQRRSPTRDSARIGLTVALGDLRSCLGAGDTSAFLAILARPLDVARPTSANRKIVAEILPDAIAGIVDELGRARTYGGLVAPLLSWAFQMLEDTKAYLPLAKVMLQLLEKTFVAVGQGDALRVFADTLVFHWQIFVVSGFLPTLVVRLFDRFEGVRQKASMATGGTSSRMLPVKRAIARLVMKCPASDDTRRVCDWLVADSQSSGTLAHSTVVPSAAGAPPMNKEFEIVLRDPSAETASQVVSSLYWLYHNHDSWGGMAWATTLSVLPDDLNDTSLAAFVHLCEDLHARIPGGLAAGVVQAFRNAPISPLSAGARVLLVELAAEGILDVGVVLHYHVISVLEKLAGATDDATDARIAEAMSLLSALLLDSQADISAAALIDSVVPHAGSSAASNTFARDRRRTHLCPLWMASAPSEAALCIGRIFTHLTGLAESRQDTSIGERARALAFALAEDDLVRRLALSRSAKVFAFCENPFSLGPSASVLGLLERLVPLTAAVSSDPIELVTSTCFLNCQARAYRLQAMLSAGPDDQGDPGRVLDYLETGLLDEVGEGATQYLVRRLPSNMAAALSARLIKRLGASLDAPEAAASIDRLCQCLAIFDPAPPSEHLVDSGALWASWGRALRTTKGLSTERATDDVAMLLSVASAVMRLALRWPIADAEKVDQISDALELVQDPTVGDHLGFRVLDAVALLMHSLSPDDLAQLDVSLRHRRPELYRPSGPQTIPLPPMARLQQLLGSRLRASSSTNVDVDGKPSIAEDKPWEEMDSVDPDGPAFVSLASLGVRPIERSETPTAASSSPLTDAPPRPAAEATLKRGERSNFEHEIDYDGVAALPVHFFRSLALGSRGDSDARPEAGDRTVTRGGAAEAAAARNASEGKKRKAEAEAVEEPARATRSTTARKKSTASTKRGKKK